MHVKKGDKVIVIAGKDKGKSSTVVSVDREKNRVVLEGLNMMKKHIKSTKAGAKTATKGGIVDIAMSIHASNVKLADKTAAKVKPAAKAKKATKKEDK